MTKENHEDYDLFYAELPQADYLNDIEIQDEYETSAANENQGLSDEQVSQIARDSLEHAKQQPRTRPAGEDTVFPEDSQSAE